MSERETSEHEVRVYEAVRTDGGWLTAREVSAKADVAPRTARLHVGKLADLGVFDVARVFGGYRYRMKSDLAGEAAVNVARIEAAKLIFLG